MKRVAIMLVSLVVMCTAGASAWAMSLPETAQAMGRELDYQLAVRLGASETPLQGQTLIMTVPADLNALDVTTPLSRQLAEDLAAWFVQAGYRVQEIRKGRDISMAPGVGETLLTRQTGQLDQSHVDSAIIAVGTYVSTRTNVRFNIRLIHATSNEVLAMCSRSISVSGEIHDLMVEPGAPTASATPGVSTTLVSAYGGGYADPYQVYQANREIRARNAYPVSQALPPPSVPVYIPPVNR